MNKIIETETKRLLLRQWRQADKAPFAQINADKRVMAFFPRRLSKVESDVWVENAQFHIETQGWGFWAVETKQQRQLIGFVGLRRPTIDLPFNPCVEMGWRLGYEYWDYGYATEAAQQAIKVGFERLNLPKIVSFTALKNLRSQAVMRRLGMQAANTTFMHPQLPTDSALREHCLYELSQTAWRMQAHTF